MAYEESSVGRVSVCAEWRNDSIKGEGIIGKKRGPDISQKSRTNFGRRNTSRKRSDLSPLSRRVRVVKPVLSQGVSAHLKYRETGSGPRHLKVLRQTKLCPET